MLAASRATMVPIPAGAVGTELMASFSNANSRKPEHNARDSPQQCRSGKEKSKILLCPGLLEMRRCLMTHLVNSALAHGTGVEASTSGFVSAGFDSVF